MSLNILTPVGVAYSMNRYPEEVPAESIYYWMYRQGLRHCDLNDVVMALRSAGKDIRKKDIENYWNGWYRSDLYSNPTNSSTHIVFRNIVTATDQFTTSKYEDFEKHPYEGMPEILNRWVPCNYENKPLIKWSEGTFTKGDALAYRGCKYLAENLKGTQWIVIDCDGDHDSKSLDYKAIEFLARFIPKTHALMKPKLVKEYGPIPEQWKHLADIPASFHLTFKVNRLIPTMHFPYAHMDIIGNAGNSLRYLKTKVHNGIEPIEMTQEIWEQLTRYVERRSSEQRFDTRTES